MLLQSSSVTEPMYWRLVIGRVTDVDLLCLEVGSWNFENSECMNGVGVG